MTHPKGEKRCIGCGKTKLLRDFYRVHKGSEERQSRCKRCDNESRVKRFGGRDHGSTGKFCRLCCGLPWRVQGGVCRDCGLECREEGVR